MQGAEQYGSCSKPRRTTNDSGRSSAPTVLILALVAQRGGRPGAWQKEGAFPASQALNVSIDAQHLRMEGWAPPNPLTLCFSPGTGVAIQEVTAGVFEVQGLPPSKRSSMEDLGMGTGGSRKGREQPYCIQLRTASDPAQGLRVTRGLPQWEDWEATAAAHVPRGFQ